jgi:hypothetical protein
MIGNAIAGLYGTGVAPSTTAYESIATTTVGSGGTATITFSSIPSTYTHLQIRYFAKNTSADYSIRAQFNSDTAANYSYHGLYGTGSTVAAYSGASQTYMQFGNNADTTTSVFAGGIIDILDYTNTNKYKTTKSLTGWDKNGGGIIELTSSSWRSTSAVTSISLFDFAGDFAQYSSFALYGIKGA